MTTDSVRREPLPRDFYRRHPADVAQDLIGKLLVRELQGETLSGLIVETEAYLSHDDAAAHGFKGRTKRNESLYKEGGHAYVHAMQHHWLLDLVTEGHEVPSSVLIRALEPVTGIPHMMRLRQKESPDHLTNGPGKICAALGITRALDGADVTMRESGLYVTEGRDGWMLAVSVSPRIGISKAADLPLRFHLTGNPYVSRKA